MLVSNFAAGAPGSTFTFTASNLPLHGTVTIDIQEPGRETYGTYAVQPVGANGGLVFLVVAPPDARLGMYTVRITVEPEDAALAGTVQIEQTITVDANQPIHMEHPAEATLILILRSEQKVYLPLLKM
jgi:hypothetical protein